MTSAAEYRLLLKEIDDWFIRCQRDYPDEIDCAKSCSECCRGLFDITLLDALLLNTGFAALPAEVSDEVKVKAVERLRAIQQLWPEFEQPFILNHHPEIEIEALLASDNVTPCVLLDNDDSCLLYAHRPMTCRLHGLPLTDVSGEVMESDCCTKNFSGRDPLLLKSLQDEFVRIFQMEAELGRCFTAELLGKAVGELDTVIPAALLIDFKEFDWRGWFARNFLRT